MKNYLNIVNAEYLNDYIVRLTFADNTVKDINFSNFLLTHSHPQYNRFRNLKNFRKFQLKNGNIVWGKNADLCFHEEELYNGVNP
jgi:hypothetical protein